MFIEMFVYSYNVYIAHHCQVFPQEAPNSTNIDEVIKKASDNDSELTDINLNNIKYISDEKWANLFKVGKEMKKDNKGSTLVKGAFCIAQIALTNFPLYGAATV